MIVLFMLCACKGFCAGWGKFDFIDTEKIIVIIIIIIIIILITIITIDSINQCAHNDKVIIQRFVKFTNMIKK